MTPCQQIMTSLSSHRFMTVLVQSGSQIPHAWCIIIAIIIIITPFYLAKTEKRTKKFLTFLSHYCFE